MSGTTAGGAKPQEPFRNYNFRLDIGDPAGEVYFTECSGLGIRVNTIRYRESGTNQIVRALPGAVEYSDVTLRYGLSNSTALWDWLMATVGGRANIRRNVSLIVLQPDGQTEGLRWNLIDAFPSEWTGAAFDALGREAAIEQLRLSFNEIRRG